MIKNIMLKKIENKSITIKVLKNYKENKVLISK